MSSDLFELAGHVAVVTGGGNSGIGLGMASGLAEAGAAVCIWGTNESKNAAALEQLRTHGTQVAAMQVDVGDEQQVTAALRAVADQFGAVDSCFANAAVTGGYGNPSFLDSTLDDWRRVLRVGLAGIAVYLAGPASSWHTGDTIRLDGGYSVF